MVEIIFSFQFPHDPFRKKNSQHPKVKQIQKAKRDLDKIKIRNKKKYTSYTILNLKSPFRFLIRHR